MLLAIAGCSGSTSSSAGTPAQLVVTVVSGLGSPVTNVGFPAALQNNTTLQISALDSVGRPIQLDGARYRFDLAPLTVAGFYVVTPQSNTVLGVAVIQAASSKPITWKLTDLSLGRVVIGPVTTNVQLQ